MAAVQARCDLLASAIGKRDLEGVEYAARIATSMWLTGRLACHRLIEPTKRLSPYTDAARQLLEANYMRILELLSQAAETIAVPSMRNTLDGLRRILTSTMAQPFSDSVSKKRADADEGD